MYVSDGSFPNFTLRMWRSLLEHINARLYDCGRTFVYTPEHVKSRIDTLKKKYQNEREKKMNQGRVSQQPDNFMMYAGEPSHAKLIIISTPLESDIQVNNYVLQS